MSYLHGHHASVLSSHSWRTVENSAAYLIPHIKPGMRVLDIGCGPGTITADFARLVGPEGHVTGLEQSADVLPTALRNAQEKNVADRMSFTTGDIHDLVEFEDDSFDIVHVHQVLQHIPDPVKALQEMRRVSRGIVAAREVDFKGAAWYPDLPALDGWQEIYLKVARSTGGDPLAGRRLLSWALKAGFTVEQVDCTSTAWCYTGKEQREWWSKVWSERTQSSNFKPNALKSGFATQQDLDEISSAWNEWGAHEAAWFSILHGEIICRVV